MTSKAARVCKLKDPRGSFLKLHRDSDCGEVSIGDAAARITENLKVDAAGTIAALNTLHLGDAADFASRPGRGGARNRACRESFALKRAQVENLIAATQFSCEIGLPFNRMITIHWEAAGISLKDMAKATSQFLDLMTKVLSRRGGQIAWLWVHEGGISKGGHCHMLVHIPSDMIDVVTEFQRRWLRAITESPYRKGVIRGKPIGLRRGLEVSNPPLHRENLFNVMSYVIKGAYPDVAAAMGLPRLQPGGRVIGRRCSTSQNIGAKARAQHQGLLSPRSLGLNGTDFCR